MLKKPDRFRKDTLKMLDKTSYHIVCLNDAEKANMAYFLTVRPRTAARERGFSALNRIKTNLRCSLGQENLRQLMAISVIIISTLRKTRWQS